MSTAELREQLHVLVDAISNRERLERIHELLTELTDEAATRVLASLNEAQRERVLKANAHSMDLDSLRSSDEVLKRRRP